MPAAAPSPLDARHVAKEVVLRACCFRRLGVQAEKEEQNRRALAYETAGSDDLGKLGCVTVLILAVELIAVARTTLEEASSCGPNAPAETQACPQSVRCLMTFAARMAV